MKKPVAILASLALTGSILIGGTVPALAGNCSYQFYDVSGLSKESYAISWYDRNTKAVTGRDWVVKATTITLPDSTTPSYGIAHVLYNVKTEAINTENAWLKAPGRKVGQWLSTYGVKGELYGIGARLDTNYKNGRGTTVGVFNSDAY